MVNNSAYHRWSKRLLMAIVLLGATSAVMATLRKRPAIEAPQEWRGPYRDASLNQTVAIANAQLAQMSQSQGLSQADAADDIAIARRLSLALVGNQLSIEEIRALSLVKPENRIRWWTEYLLQDRRWADYFAERFARAYVGTEQGPFILFRRRRFTTWLADEFERGTSYDSIVKAMLSSEGLWTDTPQVNFVTATIEQGRQCDPVRLAGRTSRAFLAQRIDCLQCHDDFLGTLNFGDADNRIDGVQQHFHELAAFFGGTGIPEIVFQGVRDDDTPYEVQYLGDEAEQQVTPAVPFYPELLPIKGKPRERLAAWVTDPGNQAFSRATVNRVWALMCSRPLVTPVDSIPIDEEVPPILDTLADDFANNGFDIRRLIRLIASTDAFQRSSRADFEVTEDHEQAWAVFPLTQLRPEQVAGSVFQSGKLNAIDETSSIFTQLKSFGDLSKFLKQFGDQGEDEFDQDAVTIAQRLIMMNGDIVQERTKVDLVNNAATRIATLVSDDDKVIDLVYLSALNRRPVDQERAAFLAHLDGKRNNARSRAVGDMMWALINSTEFSWNH